MTTDQTTSAALDQLVTFRLADEELAIPIHLVQEIIRLPEITRVPAAPSYVDGLGNLRGNLLPIVNLRRRLGLGERARDDQTRVVVLRSAGGSTGVIVDSVSEVMTIDPRILETPPASVAGIEGQYLRSIAKVDEGKRLVLILDENKMLPDLEWASNGANMQAEQNAEHQSRSGNLQQDVEQFVTFNVGAEEYAINIMQVKEIIRVTAITPVPKAPDYVIGVMSLRNHLLPIMDLRVRFGMPPADATGEGAVTNENKRIVVVDLNGTLTGIQVDSVSQVLTMEKSRIENPPTIVKSRDADCLRGVGKLDNGKRILMILEIARLMTETDQKALEGAADAKAEVDLESARRSNVSDEAQLVCFRTDREEYALDIMKVQEIIRLKEITAVPHSKDYMQGIINLRGTVVPVIDMRVRFGIEPTERNDQNRIVVINMSGKVTGLIVDSVSEVIRMPKSQIEIAPTTVADRSDHYIEGVGKLDDGKRILVLIKAEALLADDEGTAA